MIRHRYIASKMMKTDPLMQSRSVSRHVPQTVWYSDTQLVEMLRKWKLVYVKPDTGSGGRGVIRVQEHHDGYVVSWQNHRLHCRMYELPRVVRAAMISGHRYVIQRGVHLAKVRGRPFDLRIVWQKPGAVWELTWMSAKNATKKNATVTNVAQGGVDARLIPTLKQMEPPVDAEKMRRQLVDVSRRIVRVLGRHFPLRIIGLDMAIDKNRHIWYIEANTKPNFHGLRKLDPVQYRRYERALRQLRRNMNKTST